jgi:hypothetical protein
MAEAQTLVPRVTKQFLPNHVGQAVRFVGNIADYDRQHNVLILQGADNQITHVYASPEVANMHGTRPIKSIFTFQALLKFTEPLILTSVLENFLMCSSKSLVNSNFRISSLTVLDLGNYEQLIGLMHSTYRNLFM